MMFEKRKLGDIYTFQYGTGNTIEDIGGDYPIYGSNGPVGFTDKYNSEDSPVIGHIGAYAGIVNWASGKHFVTYNGVICTAKDGIDKKFAYYTLLNANLTKRVRGSTQPFVSYDLLQDVDILLPEINEQCKISKVLSSIDDKISINNKIIETSERLMREIYDYWFVQFDFPDENGRPYKSSGGKMVYNETLRREIPKGWIAKELGEIIIEAKKSSVQVSEARERTGVYPFFTSGDEIIDFEDYYVDGFNIFLNTGGNADVKSYYGKSAYSTDTWCISAKDYSFMLAIFLSSIKTYLNDNCFAGSGLKHLQKNIFKQIKIVVPDVKTLDTFNSIASSIYEDITACQIENKKLASLRDWLLPMLMNGQVMVDDRILNNNAPERVEDDNIGLY